MSAIFLVDVTEMQLEYDELNRFVNSVVSFALQYNMGARFHDSEYFPQIVQEKKMKQYFYLSDSFLHCNANFLDMCEFAYLSGEEFKKAFYQKFSFVEELIQVIRNYHVAKVEIYASDDGSVEKEEDFEIVYSTGNNLLNQLYNKFFSHGELNVFPTVKIVLSLW